MTKFSEDKYFNNLTKNFSQKLWLFHHAENSHGTAGGAFVWSTYQDIPAGGIDAVSKLDCRIAVFFLIKLKSNSMNKFHKTLYYTA